MTTSSIDRKFLNRHLRSRIVWLLILALFTVGVGALGVVNIQGLTKDLTTTYTSTTGEVIDEGTQRVLQGSRRSKHWVDKRNITIEYTINGATSSDTVLDKDIQVGESLPIWVDEKTGDVKLEKPAAPGFWNWTWAIVVPIIAILFLWGVVVTARNGIRLSRFNPNERQPDFVFTLQDIAVVNGEGRNAKKRTFQFKGVTGTNSVAKRVGERAQLAVSSKHVPEAQTYPATITGYYLKPGVESVTTVLHTPELGAWWVADLTFPADVEIASTPPKSA